MTYTEIDKNPYTKEITISFTIPPKDFIYKDFITFSVDDPNISLSPWKANNPTVAHYDSSFKEAKQVFDKDFTIFITTTIKYPESHIAHIHCSYYRKSEKKINHVLFPLTFIIPEPTAEEAIDNIETIETHTATLKPIKKSSSLDYYTIATLSIMQAIVTSLHTDHKKYFAFLVFIIMVLISFFYFFRQELQTHIKIKEWLEIIISMLITISAVYLLTYFHTITTPLTTIIIAYLCTLYAGIFYIKKSTKVQSKNLRTLCTFMGILCMSSTLFLLFKGLQYADQQFNLL